MSTTSIIPSERINELIRVIRDQKVLLDSDLEGSLRSRNETFPADFMFQLTFEELTNLRSQFGTSSSHGGRRYRPYAFSEEGVGMLSSVLRSPRAVSVNIEIIRTFVRLRRFAMTHEALARKVTTLERKYDTNFKIVLDAIRKLITADPHNPTLGFARKKVR